MLKNAIESSAKTIYLFIREAGSGKTEELKNHLNDNHMLVDHSHVEGVFKSKDKINIINNMMFDNPNYLVIDGIVDNFDNAEIESLYNLLNKWGRKTIIVSNNSELIYTMINISKNNLILTQNNNAEDPIDFKVIAENHHLTWEQIYIDYFWAELQFNEGNIKYENNTLKMNEADVAALIIASRYWGKASLIFQMKENLEDAFFGNLSDVFFHKTDVKVNMDDLLNLLTLPPYISVESLKTYLSEDGVNLGYSHNNMNNILNDMLALKEVKFSLFIKSLWGRWLLVEKADFITPDKMVKYTKVISTLAHSVDFLIIQLITRDEVKIDEVIKELESL